MPGPGPVIPAPGGPGGAFAVRGTLVGKDANYDGLIEPNEMGFIAGGGGAINPGGGGDDCGDCVRTYTTFKTVQVPCTRNKYQVVNYQVPQTVPYTDFETVTKMRPVTKQVPKTILVPTTEVVPYQDTVPVTKTKVIQVPKSRTECYPVTTVVTRRVPVVSVIPKPPQPCPPMGGRGGGMGGGIGPVAPGAAFAAPGVLVGKDANFDGRIERNEMGFIATGGVMAGGGGGIGMGGGMG